MVEVNEKEQEWEQQPGSCGERQHTKPLEGDDADNVSSSAATTTPKHRSYNMLRELPHQKPHVKFFIAEARPHTHTTTATGVAHEGSADDLVLIKHRSCPNPAELRDALTEAAVMALVSYPAPCPTVVPLLFCFADNMSVVMVMPYVEGGDLCDVISKANGPLGEDSAKRYFSDLIQALLHLKGHNIAHGDVSLENVMLTSRNTDRGYLRAQLIDMGSACVADSTGTIQLSMFSYRGKLGYVPPEVLHLLEAAADTPSDVQGSTIDPFAIDVWAAAYCLYTMLTGRPLFNHPSDLAFERLKEQGGDLLLMTHYEKFHLTVPQQAKDLICAMLQPDPAARPTLEKILAHPWLSSATGPTAVVSQGE